MPTGRAGQAGAGSDGGTGASAGRPPSARRINRRQVEGADFTVDEDGAVALKDDARKAVLAAWQDRKKDELRHPFLGETMPLGLVGGYRAKPPISLRSLEC